MTLETKTDNDWYQIMSQMSINSPVWFLFGKSGSQKTEGAKLILENLQTDFPAIKFYFFDMIQSPGAKSISSIDREGTNVLYVFGIEFSRFRSDDENFYEEKAQDLVNNFNSSCSPAMQYGKWDGININIQEGVFTTTDTTTYQGINLTVSLGKFETQDQAQFSGINILINPGNFISQVNSGPSFNIGGGGSGPGTVAP